jgi:hypothetical protein
LPELYWFGSSRVLAEVTLLGSIDKGFRRTCSEEKIVGLLQSRPSETASKQQGAQLMTCR